MGGPACVIACTTFAGDNSHFGYGEKGNRIGLRGAGAISWAALNAAYGTNLGASVPYYPSTLSASVQALAVQQACATGNLYYYSPTATTYSTTAVTTATLLNSSGGTNTANPAGIQDYAPIPNAYKEISAFQIANEAAATRAAGTPLYFNLQVTPTGLLSLSYSQSGGAYSYLVKGLSITATNGPLPPTFRFGFAASTGAHNNIHEIMCFKAAAANTSGSSATVNEKQAAKVEAGTQAYFAFYNPNNWTGSLTANNLIDTGGTVSVSTTANWDAGCLLTGTAAGTPATGGGCISTNASGPTSATPTPTSRVMLTWDTTNKVGIPFEWASVNSNQQAVLDDENGTPDSPANPYRLNYLRGDRSNEITSAGTSLYSPPYRARDNVLADIVDSSPTWVGPPSLPYTATWIDHLQSSATMPENTGTQSYVQFVTAEQSRLNVVYVGANDGFLHGFRAGAFDANGIYCGTAGSAFTTCASTPNDGQEVLAYMPGSTLYSAALSSTTAGCTGIVSSGTQVQNIHGWTPVISPSTKPCESPEIDYSSTLYGHNFFVDATPGMGDLFYNNTWHTWLVGGLGAGGTAIYALDITNPAATNFTETNASHLVMGEWNAGTITCSGVTTNCGPDLGNTFGTPQIRRLHNGTWGAIFGNGYNSVTGDAGIFVMSISSTGTATFYYLSTTSGSGSSIFSGTASQALSVVTVSAVAAGSAPIAVGDVFMGAGVVGNARVISFGTGTGGTGTYNVSTSGTASSGAATIGNGIAFATPADLDGDHITDYVYAGDLKGKLWRFDLTAANPALWGVTNSSGVSVNGPASSTTLTGYGADANGNGGGSPAPVFTTPTGQPISTAALVVSNIVTGQAARLLIEFGTGQRMQITNAYAASYMSGTQALYGVWDWNLSAWNAVSGIQYASLTTAASTLPSPYTLSYSNLQSQTLTITAATAGTSNQVVDETTSATVCWEGSTTCGTGNNAFGWYANLPGAGEQVIYEPVFAQGAFIVNTVVPANNLATSCSALPDTGFSYALNIVNGGAFTGAFPTYTKNGTLLSDATTAGVETNATGSVYVVQTVEGKLNIVYQTVSGTPGAQQLNLPTNTKAKRLTWIERR